MATRPLVDFSSGAYRRAAAKLPKLGTKGPWASRQSYWRDFLTLRFAPLGSGADAVEAATLRHALAAAFGAGPAPAAALDDGANGPVAVVRDLRAGSSRGGDAAAASGT